MSNVIFGMLPASGIFESHPDLRGLWKSIYTSKKIDQRLSSKDDIFLEKIYRLLEILPKDQPSVSLKTYAEIHAILLSDKTFNKALFQAQSFLRIEWPTTSYKKICFWSFLFNEIRFISQLSYDVEMHQEISKFSEIHLLAEVSNINSYATYADMIGELKNPEKLMSFITRENVNDLLNQSQLNRVKIVSKACLAWLTNNP